MAHLHLRQVVGTAFHSRDPPVAQATRTNSGSLCRQLRDHLAAGVNEGGTSPDFLFGSALNVKLRFDAFES